MLKLEGIAAAYGRVRVLHNVSVELDAGEVVCILGRNGAGKTSTMKAIMGLLPLVEGAISVDGTRMDTLSADQVVQQRVAYTPQGRRLFPELTVRENLEIGLMARKRDANTLDWVLELFPRLRERLDQLANTLSGGEQQMAAIGRALCTQPRFLLLDEPTEGLQPSMVTLIRDVVKQLASEGVGILMVEQRIDAVLTTANRVVFIENGYSRDTVDAAALQTDRSLLDTYLGV
ncbi:MAG: ABC transporter ATP-binding protein [Pseudomonadota bacterium]